MSEYNAKSIKVMSEQALAETHLYLKRDDFAKYYKLPVEHIDRLIEACELSGESWERVEAIYLDHNKEIELAPEFQEVFKELVRNQRGR
jgi:hypothetical protein